MQEHRLVLHFYIWEVQMTFRKHTKPSCLDRWVLPKGSNWFINRLQI